MDVPSEYSRTLDDHARRNDHHPEYHPDMSLEARMELTCDLLGTAMAWAHKEALEFDVAQARAFIEREQWPHWQHAVTEKLPPPAETVPELIVRWSHGWKPEEEEAGADLEGATWTHDLACVKYYVKDVMYHKDGVYKAWSEIVREHDPRFESIAERVQNHDCDSFREDVIRAYVRQFVPWRQKQEEALSRVEEAGRKRWVFRL